jgi:peroxiredoxin
MSFVGKSLKGDLEMNTSGASYKIACVILLLSAAIAGTAIQQDVRATMQLPKDRKPAPVFSLTDASGKAVRLSEYRGKVVLLDFWATECGGCKVEIPWFIEFERTYKNNGLAVVGVSMDILYSNLKNAEEGWSKVKPFVQAHNVNYRILMGDDLATKAFDINALPATYLIDRNGKIAATYVGLVNKDDVEANIKALLTER